jgi:hypothetical protein
VLCGLAVVGQADWLCRLGLAFDDFAINRTMRDDAKPIIFGDGNFGRFLEGSRCEANHGLSVIKYAFASLAGRALNSVLHDLVMVLQHMVRKEKR